MSVAEPAPSRRAGLGWVLALAGLFVAALVLRLVGLKTGLPYVYNADENSHFVPRAIGMFGHSLNPDYFINPPAFTYVIHALFALRWGTDPAAIGGAFAADPTGAFTIARGASAFLGALAVPLTAIAGARLFEDRRVGILAGALLAVAFLPVHYSHFALNDAPTLAPLALCLVGVAGIYRTGRTREYVLAGAALGVAIATKYTAGIVLVTVVAAAFASPVAHARVRNLAFALALMCAGFLASNPYALLDRHAFWDGIQKQTETAGEEGGKLGLANTRLAYYLGTFTWGFGWLPSLAALGGVGGLIARHRRLAIMLAPAPILLFLYLGKQSRFFARWMLPIYPILACWRPGASSRSSPLPAPRAGAAPPRSCSRRASCSASTTTSCSPGPTRAWSPASGWSRTSRSGTKIVMEPIAPDQWAADTGEPLFEPPSTARAGTSIRRRARASSTARSATARSAPWSSSRTTSARPAPNCSTSMRRRVLLGRHRLEPVRPRLRRPARGSGRDRLLRRAQAARRRLFRVSPYGRDAERGVLVRLLVQLLPVEYDRPGPEIVIYEETARRVPAAGERQH